MKVSEPAILTVTHVVPPRCNVSDTNVYQIRDTANDPVHYATCNVCFNHIKGVRYKVSSLDPTSYTEMLTTLVVCA